jgi:hypothetical protein
MDEQLNNQEFNTEVKSKEGKTGPVIGSVIIILIILLGGLYYLDSVKDKVSERNDEVQETEELSDEDAVNTIDADLDGLNTQELESSFDEIDLEIDSALENL